MNERNGSTKSVISPPSGGVDELQFLKNPQTKIVSMACGHFEIARECEHTMSIVWIEMAPELLIYLWLTINIEFVHHMMKNPHLEFMVVGHLEYISHTLQEAQICRFGFSPHLWGLPRGKKINKKLLTRQVSFNAVP